MKNGNGFAGMLRIRAEAILVSAALGLLCAASAAGAPEPGSTAFGGVGPWAQLDGTGPRADAAQDLADARLGFRRVAPMAGAMDVGNVAVIVNDGTIVSPPRPESPFDLSMPMDLVFAPTGDGFSVAFADASTDPVPGPVLPLGDDDTEEVALPFAFPFLGRAYMSVFVNSDGNLTFGAGDGTSPQARDAAGLLSGPPRIAPLYADLDPSAAGSVHADPRADSVVITWQGVPEWGETNTNSFQLTLTATGAIRLAYQRVDARYGVIGVAEGASEGPVNLVDFTVDVPASYSAGAILEEFGPAQPLPFFNANQAARAFYRTHSDRYDFLAVFTDVPADLGGGAWAFHSAVQNATLGIGRPLFDRSATVGSAGELESILALNNIHLYWPTARGMLDPPIRTRPAIPVAEGIFFDRFRLFGTDDGLFGRNFGVLTLGLNSAMSLMGQEVGHRWLAYTRFVHPQTGVGPDSSDLLGRGNAHWSFFHNVAVPAGQFAGEPRASSAEGNAIRDLGPTAGPCAVPGQTRFSSEPEELIDGYTRLDQYLMGVRTAASVEPFWYVDQPTTFSGSSIERLRSFDALSNATFCGRRVDLDVGDIQAFPGIGPRDPAIGDEDDTGTGIDVKTMAFVLVVEPGSSPHTEAIRQVDAFRRTWQEYANGPATGGLGRFDTVLDPAIH